MPGIGERRVARPCEVEPLSAIGPRTMARRACRRGWCDTAAQIEVPADERKDTTTAFPPRALRRFRSHGIRTERVMTANGSACRSPRFVKALRWLGIRHLCTRPDTPRTSAKAECFIQTLLRERAHGLSRPRSAARCGPPAMA